MEALPVEMVLEIAKHLSVRDLASCITVSRQWREVFGSDEVWRSRCNKDSEEYLRTTPCRVEPKFKSPQSSDSTLSPIGKWRTAFLREQHLWENWVRGNFVKDDLKKSYKRAVFFNNDFVIAINYDDDKIQLINTKESPSVCVAVLPTTISEKSEVHIILNDKFIIWNGYNTVQTIRVDWKSYALTVENSWSIHHDVVCYGVYDILKNKLVMNGHESTLHIWDIDNPRKMKTSSILDHVKEVRDEESSSDLSDGSGSEEWVSVFDNECYIHEDNDEEPLHDENCQYFGVVCSKGPVSYFFVYSVEDFEFLPFMISRSALSPVKSFVLGEKYVTLNFANADVIEVHDYRTSQHLHTFSASRSKVWSMGNSVMFILRPGKLMQLCQLSGVVQCLTTNNVLLKLSYIKCLSKKVCIAGDRFVDSIAKFYVFFTPTSSISSMIFPPNARTEVVTVNQVCSKIGIKNNYKSPVVLRFYW